MELAVGLISLIMLLFVAYAISESASKWRLESFVKRIGDGSFPVTVGWGKGFWGCFLIISINVSNGEFFKTHREIETEIAKDGQGKVILVIIENKPKLILPARMAEQIEKSRVKVSLSDYSGE